MSLYAFLTDLARQVANVLQPAHGGTGSTHGESRVVVQGHNATGGDLPLYTLVQWKGSGNNRKVTAVTALDSTRVLGVVVGYYDATGLVEADAPDGYAVAVQTAGVVSILIESAVTRDEYAYAAATDGTIYSSSTVATGSFGRVLTSADTSNGDLTALVSLPLTVGGGGGGGATFGTPSLTFSTTNGAGSGTNAIRTNATIALFDATVPAAIGTAAAGSAGTAPHRDHVHPTGAGTPSTQAFGDAASTGTGPAAAMTDHKHAMPANPTVGLKSGLVVVVNSPAVGDICDITMPYAGSFTRWAVLNDAAGSIQFDLWNDVYGSFPPTIADTITASDKPKTTGAAKAESSGTPSWGTDLAFAAGDIIRVHVDSTSGLSRSCLTLEWTRT